MVDKVKKKVVKKPKKSTVTNKMRLLTKIRIANPSMSLAEAGRLAGYSEATVQSTLYTVQGKASTKKSIKEIMDAQGITDERLMETLSEGLVANKTISATVIASNGEGMKDANSMTKDFIEVEDHPTRHKFMDTGCKLRDLFPAKKLEHAGTGGGPIQTETHVKELTLEECQKRLKFKKKQIEEILKKNKKINKK